MQIPILLCILIGITVVASQTQSGFNVQKNPLSASVDNNRILVSSRMSPFLANVETSQIKTIPFPDCVSTPEAAMLLRPTSIHQLFLAQLQSEESKLVQERARNNEILNHDILDFEAAQLRPDKMNGALIARTASILSGNIVKQLRCETNASVAEQIDAFLQTIQIPNEFCAFDSTPNCAGLTKYRTPTGVCNNLQRPYEGSSQTAFGRILTAAYQDGISAPRSQSVLGGPLPGCREISLAMGSRPAFDVSYNNMLVGYGQFIVHDITFGTPITDTGRTPITSCSCSSQDKTLCNVINIPMDDPFMKGQRCMSMPASTSAFTDSICTLGVKEQMNGNSHYLDLSATYGSTRTTAHGLRVGQHGQLKVTKKPWSKFPLPPAQREGKSCVDSKNDEKCFAGGDSRIMENILLAGIQAQWLRAHNTFSDELIKINPEWANDDELIYEEAKKILAALHQRYTYEDWLPILVGEATARRVLGIPGAATQYNPSIQGVMFNEVATSAMRLHTLVRDLLTRCKPNGQFTDQVWLHDISVKCHMAYDAKNNGVDAFICGSLYDFGSAGDTNYAQEIHHRLFETTSNGQTTRNDIVSINICRAREHGIGGYNIYRELCGLRRATTFEELDDSMSMESIQKLKSIYQHPEDIDLFVGTNHETPISGGIVGPTSACLISTQFLHLKYGDRFFYTHQGEFTPAQLQAISSYSYTCFICHTTDIEQVPRNPFRPPNEITNPLQFCNQCPLFDFKPWRAAGGVQMG